MSANSAIKRIDIKEFREAGFLQEANRQFFHPHGLALEVTTVDENGWDADAARVISLALHLANAFPSLETWTGATPIEMATAAMNALYPPNSMSLSGCWDFRDDPEGVVFGSWYGQDRERVKQVASERERHRPERARMFGAAPGTIADDVEPIGWVYPEGDGDA